MPTVTEIADWTSCYFKCHRKRTANVLAGPKRETWFSAEIFVALCAEAKPLEGNEFLTDFSCWGEESFSTVFRKIRAKAGTGGVNKKPDVVCYLPDNGPEAVDVVLELKLILNDEDPEPILNDPKSGLRAQLWNARQLFPTSKVLGLVFVAAAPLASPGAFDRAVKQSRTACECILPAGEGFSWVPHYELAPVFQRVHTDFHYPAFETSLALGVVQLQPKQTISAAT